MTLRLKVCLGLIAVMVTAFLALHLIFSQTIHTYLQGRSLYHVFLIVGGASTLLVLLVAIILVDGLVVSRVRRLGRELRTVRNRHDFSRRVSVSGSDELAQLAQEFNALLEEVDHSNRHLHEARDQAEAASRAKSLFVASMNHELRTPLNGVIGMLDVALGGNIEPVVKDYLKVARRSANSLLGIVNEVLDFSKIEAGQLALDPAEVELQKFVADTVGAVAINAYQKGLELFVHVPSDMPEAVRVDNLRLRQVLINLLGNAIKFTKTGFVTLDLRCKLQDRDEVDLIWTVVDSGVGIPRDKLNTVFEAFTQAELSTYRKHGGTGLGLTISRQIVQAMGSSITVESEMGKGTRFSFTQRVPILFNRSSERLPDSEPGRWTVVSGQTSPQELSAALSWLPGTFCIVSGIEKLEDPAGTVLVNCNSPLEAADVDALVTATNGGPVVLFVPPTVVGTFDWVSTVPNMRLLVKPILPWEVLRAVDSEPVKAASKPVERRRFLVVDDLELNRHVARHVLCMSGHEVTTAAGAKEAIDILSAGGYFDDHHPASFDCILMDLQMPEIDGLQAAQLIRQREEPLGKRLPIIALSGNTYCEARNECKAADMDGILPKPLDIYMLHQLLALTPAAPVQALGFNGLCRLKSVRQIDIESLHATFGDEGVVLELVGLFLTESDELLGGLLEACDRNDPITAGKMLHALKGSLSNISAVSLAKTAGRLENRVKGGEFAELQDEITKFTTEAEICRKALGESVATEVGEELR